MIALLALQAFASPTLIRLPSGGLVPSVSPGKQIEVAWSDRKDVFVAPFLKGKLGGAVKVSSQVETVTAGGERGPKIAQTDDAIHLVWQGPYQNGPAVWYARSTDGARTFEPQRNLVQGKTPGLDHPTIAAYGNEVVVLWLDGRDLADPDNPVANPIYFARSTDGGKTFGPNTKIESDFKGRACACCSISAQFDSKGGLTIAFRTGYRNRRDIWLLARQADQTWKSRRVSDDQWILEGCPMDGPRHFEGGCAWMSDGKVYWSHSSQAGFVQRIPIAEDDRGKYPQLASNLQGMMAIWERDNQIHWRHLGTGEQGAFPSSGNRSAIFVGPEGRFYIVN